MKHDIQRKEIPAQLALTVQARVSLATIPQIMGAAYNAIMAHAREVGAEFTGPPFCLYPETPGVDFGIVVCIPVAPGATAGEGVGLEEIPGGTVATTVHKGPYAAMEETYAAVEAWIAAEGMHPAGPPREVYLSDPLSVPESELLTEIAWPVA